MSEDINFLPKELRPKVKAGRKKDAPDIGFSRPSDLLDADERTANSPAKKSSVWRSFSQMLRHGGQPAGAGAKVSPARMTDGRNELLAHIASALPSDKAGARSPAVFTFQGLVSRFFTRPHSDKSRFAPQSKAPVAAEPQRPASVSSASPVPFSRPLVQTNLLKGQEFIFFDWSRTVVLHSVSVGIIAAIVLGAWGYLFYLDRRQSESVSALAVQLEERIASLKNLRQSAAILMPLRNKTALIQGILDKHIYWTNFFNYLEVNTLPSVYYQSFEGDLSGSYELSANARDFNSFIAQLKVWQAEKIYTKNATAQTVSIVSAAAGTGDEAAASGAVFNLNMVVDQGIFYK